MKKQRRTIQPCLCCAGLALVLVAILLYWPRPAVAEPTDKNWIKDPITGCGVWTDKAEQGEIVSWSGGCKEGKASGSGVLS